MTTKSGNSFVQLSLFTPATGRSAKASNFARTLHAAQASARGKQQTRPYGYGVSILQSAKEELELVRGDQTAEAIRPERSMSRLGFARGGVLPRQIQLVSSDRLREGHAPGNRTARASVPISHEERRRDMAYLLLLLGGQHATDHFMRACTAALDQINSPGRTK